MRGDRGDDQWRSQARSELVARHGVVASSHAVASQIGVQILQEGGTAADAAVATAAVLGVVEPESAGLGADMIALYYEARSGKLHAINATGWAPAAWTPAYFERRGHDRWTGMPASGADSVTIPGGLDGWCRLHERFGAITLSRALEPAVTLAEQGFGISELVHRDWQASVETLRADPDSAATFLVDGEAPALYSLFRNPELARALRALQEHGRDAFYDGEIGRAIVAKVMAAGGMLAASDLGSYQAEWVEPISTSYRGYDICQAPPNAQGFAVLEILNVLEACTSGLGCELSALGPQSPLFWHLLIEAKKLVFADLNAYNADPRYVDVPVERLLGEEHAQRLGARIDPHRAAIPAARVSHGGGTVYFATADRWGNMGSFISSLANGTFGSGVTVPGYGFPLHSRGLMFSLEAGHPNVVAPGKRPFHTIIPAFIMDNGRPVAAFGNMGGHMQVQAQATEVVNMIDLGMNVQAAGDAARFLHDQATNRVDLESELFSLVGDELAAMGHDVHAANGAQMGGYQAIHFTPLPDEPAPGASVDGDPPVNGIYRAASDHRKDGEAVGW